MCHGYKHNTVYSEDFVTLAFTFYAWHCYIPTLSQGQNKKFDDRPRTNARGQGQIFEAEDKILASRT